MMTFRQIISRWASLADFAADLGVSPNTAKAMRTRNSVAPEWWGLMLKGAEARGFPLTAQELIEAAAFARAKRTCGHLSRKFAGVYGSGANVDDGAVT